MAKAENGTTIYSDEVTGSRENHNMPVRFDLTDGCLGITQMNGTSGLDRVLLTPLQLKALREFVDRR